MSADHAEIERRLSAAADHYFSAPAEALRIADETLAAVDAAGDLRLRSKALTTRGVALAYLSRYDESLSALQHAQDALLDGDEAQRFLVLRCMSVAYDEMGALEESLDWAVRAAELARAQGSPTRLAEALLSVAIVRSRCGDTAGGLADFREVLAHMTACGDRSGALQVTNNIAIALKNLGRHQEAVEHLMRVMQSAREEGNEGIRAVASANLGEPLAALGRRAEARAVLAEAAAGLEKAGYGNGEVHARTLLGQLMLEDGEPEAALLELERALAICQRKGSRSHVAKVNLALSQLHRGQGRFEQALAHHEAYHAAERSQFNDDSAKRLHALQVRFQLAGARHEAEVARLRSVELAALSRTDALTGLPNRRHLDQCLAEEIARAHRLGHPLALAIADIDDFKPINDRFGHAVGDVVLRHMADLLRRHCRAIDLVARWGGEEFCILFIETDAVQAMRACELMRAAVAGLDWQAIHPGLKVTLSMGLADLAAGHDPVSLLAAADKRLYSAKRDGKNRVL